MVEADIAITITAYSMGTHNTVIYNIHSSLKVI